MNSLLTLALAATSLAAPLASSNSYFATHYIGYSSASGRPGDNLNYVTFNITDVKNGGHADCDASFDYTTSGPSAAAPAICGNSSTFSWYFSPGNHSIDGFILNVDHKLARGGWANGTSPEYQPFQPNSSFECGGSGHCAFDETGDPLKIYFNN